MFLLICIVIVSSVYDKRFETSEVFKHCVGHSHIVPDIYLFKIMTIDLVINNDN